MKTIKIISALSLVLVFATASSIFAGRNSKTGNLPADRVKVITYVVNVDNSHNFTALARHYLIIMTDENGRQIAPSQSFRNGVWSYTFKEVGNVIGTRVAKMVLEPSAPGSPAISSRAQTGTFLGGQSYLFLLGTPTGAIETVNSID